MSEPELHYEIFEKGKRLWKEAKQAVKPTFDVLCHTIATKAFMVNALKNAQYIAMAAERRSTVPSKQGKARVTVGIVAIALMYHTGPDLKDHLYVDLICTRPGFGRELMGKIEEFAVRQAEAEVVSLRAIDVSAGFFKRIGYKRVLNACDKRPRKTYHDAVNGTWMSKCVRTLRVADYRPILVREGRRSKIFGV